MSAASQPRADAAPASPILQWLLVIEDRLDDIWRAFDDVRESLDRIDT